MCLNEAPKKLSEVSAMDELQDIFGGSVHSVGQNVTHVMDRGADKLPGAFDRLSLACCPCVYNKYLPLKTLSEFPKETMVAHLLPIRVDLLSRDGFSS